jgi:hypothetical protein
MFAKYYACDPLQLGLVKQTDQVDIFFIQNYKADDSFFSLALSNICYGNIKTI